MERAEGRASATVGMLLPAGRTAREREGRTGRRAPRGLGPIVYGRLKWDGFLVETAQQERDLGDSERVVVRNLRSVKNSTALSECMNKSIPRRFARYPIGF